MTKNNLAEMNEAALTIQAMRCKEEVAEEMEKLKSEKACFQQQRACQAENGDGADQAGTFRRGGLPYSEHFSGVAFLKTEILIILSFMFSHAVFPQQ